MKKTILFSVILALFCTFSFAQKGFDAKFSQPSSSEYQVAFSLNDWSIQHVQFNGEDFQQIVFNNSAVTNKKGWAELPFISASIQLPARKNVDVSVVLTEYTDYQLDFPLVPSRGVIYRNQDQTTIPFEIDPESMIDKFYPADIATADEPYIIRDVRGTSIRVFPFQYNAVSKTLRVYTKVDVLLTENKEPATNPLLVENPNPIREVRGMYKSIFMNYQETRVPLAMAEYGDILVITTARDETAIQPYIDWKKQKGYNVTKEVVATGTNVKQMVKDKYTANPNLMYVLLVGDWADIKCDTYYMDSENRPTDPMLGDVAGTASDYRPDISIGRMSANSAAHVTIQVDKTIQYEKNPNMEAAWYSSFIGIGSNDSFSVTPDDNEKDWLHIQRIYSQRLEPTYNYNTHYRLYENESGCTAANLGNYINVGASTIAYCGHGAKTYFVTTGFSNTNVNSLTNGTKLPFIVSVACVNGAFHDSNDCFAEAWLRKQNGGAVVTWMSTINQPIAEPMRGQDYFYDILNGGFDYTPYSGQSGITTNELRTHWGAIVVNAANLMLSESSLSGDKETVRTWTTFGDPSLQLRTKQPAVLAFSGPPMYVGMPYTTTVTANGAPVKDALVCISQNGVYASAFTDENGAVSIANEFTPGEALLVITAFNTNTIYQTIECIPPSGPYMVYDSYNVVGGDNLTYISENATVEVTLKNVGVAATSGALSVAFACNDPLLTINTATVQITNPIPAGGTATVTCKVTVAHTIPDNKSFPVDITVTGAGKVEWESNMNLKAYAPNFTLKKVLINDVENGNLPKGALVKITAIIENKGGADAFTISDALEISSEYVTLACGDPTKQSIAILPAGESTAFTFYTITSPSMPFGHEATFNLSLTAQYGIAFNTSFNVSCTGNNAYCMPTSSNCSGYNDRITSLQIIKNSDMSVLFNTPPTCSSNGYTDYTTTSLNFEPGATYTIKVKIGYQNHRVRGWIDFNDNNTFDSNELLFTITCATAGTEYSATFTIPETADPGSHRFRMRTRDQSTNPEPCDVFSYGQTLDYTAVIPEFYPRVQNVAAQLGTGAINITWNAPTEGAPVGYNIYRDGNLLNSTPVTATNFTENDITVGIYAYNVTAVYTGNHESFSEMSNVICFFLACEKPVNVEVALEEKTATITWENSANMEGEFKGYQVYCNGIIITGATLLSEPQFVVENLVPGTYCYQVESVYTHCTSDPTENECITIDPEFCEAPTQLSSILEDHTVILTWNKPNPIDGVFVGYNVYRDETQINEEIIEDEIYYDEDVAEGTYQYQVSAVYQHCNAATELKVEVGINDLQTASYSIFPNPTTGKVTIKGDGLTRVEIYDIQGRILADYTNINEVLQINDLSRYESGIYFVKMYSGTNMTATKQLVIVR